jgi:transcriptional regulator with XRE-family HTH domain
MTFKDRLRNIIEYKGLLMKQVALSAGIKQSTFLSYVDARGRIPPADVAVKIAKVLNVSVEYLIEGADTETTETDMFYRKYKKYSDILQEFDKLSHTAYKSAKTAILMMLSGFQNSELEKKENNVSNY